MGACRRQLIRRETRASSRVSTRSLKSVYEADDVTLVIFVMAEYWHKVCSLCLLG